MINKDLQKFQKTETKKIAYFKNITCLDNMNNQKDPKLTEDIELFLANH